MTTKTSEQTIEQTASGTAADASPAPEPGSVHARLLDAHPDRPWAADGWDFDAYPGAFSLGFASNGDGAPIAGLSWVTNHKGEEEFGARDLRTRLTGPSPRNFHTLGSARTYMAGAETITGAPDTACALALATAATFQPTPAAETGDGSGDRIARFAWGDSVRRYAGDTPTYPRTYALEMPYKQGLPTMLDYRKMDDLRVLAREVGVTPLPRRKADLIAAIYASERFQEKAERPGMWPALFAYGDTLVLRADTGPTATVLRALIEAADAGRLGVGDASGPFSTGMFFYDIADEHPSMVEQRDIEWDYYDARMPVAEKLADGLRKDGYSIYHLGTPCRLDPMGRYDGEHREVFWVNIYLGKQAIFGYYSDAEIESRAFDLRD